ncbi:hypothetical protein BHM03_00036829 [Ensete ventricosum]|nr:hypothetical protein BHM03_00036829 [Ensete ventricosum]
MFTARYGRYVLIRQVAGTRTARYRAVPSKIDRRRLISTVGDRLKGEIDCQRSIEREKGRKKKRKKKKKKEKRRKNTYRPRAVLARVLSPLVRRRRPRAASARAGALSPARGERSRRRSSYRCTELTRYGMISGIEQSI